MSLAYKISAFNRKRKWNLFLQEIKPSPSLKVLDIGFSENELSTTDNFIEKNYPYPKMLTALGIGNPNNFKNRYPKINTVTYDGYKFPFPDKSFDIAWSNAVIEHVGDKNRQLLFLKEIKRVSKKAFITTPNKYFPIEVHTRFPLIHYLPKIVRDKCFSIFGKKWATGDYMNLLSLSNIKSLLKELNIKEYKIIKNRLLGFILDFVIIIKLEL